MKNIFPINFLSLPLLFIFSNVSMANSILEENSQYQQFQSASKTHRVELKNIGLAYMAGGAIGLGSSIYLSVKSRDPLSKVGYSLIQALSTASIAYGANRYFLGDGFTQAAERIERTKTELENTNSPNISILLNKLTIQELEEQRSQFRKERNIRAAVSLCSAVSAGATLAFSKKKSSSASLTLGFIGFVSLAASISDFLSKDIPESYTELYAKNNIELDPIQKRILFTWRW